MKFGLNIVANGAHAAGRRMPQVRVDAALDIRLWKQMARAAEAAGFHVMFRADGMKAIPTSNRSALSPRGRIR
jgi:N-acetyl-S-(2-succino)cysteine monooxygenase